MITPIPELICLKCDRNDRFHVKGFKRTGNRYNVVWKCVCGASYYRQDEVVKGVKR